MGLATCSKVFPDGRRVVCDKCVLFEVRHRFAEVCYRIITHVRSGGSETDE